MVLAGLAFIIALDPKTMVLDLGGIRLGRIRGRVRTGADPVAVLAAHDARGRLAGVLTGGITVVVWKQLEGGLFDLYEIVPGFLLSLLAIWIAS